MPQLGLGLLIALCGVHGFPLIATSLGSFKRNFWVRLGAAGVFVAGAVVSSHFKLSVADFHVLTQFESGESVILEDLPLVLLICALGLMWWWRIPALWLSLLPLTVIGHRLSFGEAQFGDFLILWLGVAASFSVGFGLTVLLYGAGQWFGRLAAISRQTVLAWEGGALGAVPKAEHPWVSFAMMTMQNGSSKVGGSRGLQTAVQYSGNFWDVPATLYAKTLALLVALLVVFAYGYLAFPILETPITSAFGNQGFFIAALIFCGSGFFLWRGGLETPLHRLCHYTHSTSMAMHGSILVGLSIAIVYDLSMPFVALYLGAYLAAGYLAGHFASYRVQRFGYYALIVPWVLVIVMLLYTALS